MKTRKHVLFLLLLLLAERIPACAAEPGNHDKILVGINYFAGWWEALPNKWHGEGWNTNEADWRPAFPDRVPLLGSYNDQATMDREIAAAASHGVDFFAMLWYFPKPDSDKQAQARLLNRGLETFLASSNASRLKFMIEYCNAPDFSAATDAEWRDCLKTWVAALRHPSALRVDSRLVFKIHGADQFLRTHDRNLERCEQRLNELRQAARQAGLGELLIGGGIMSRSQVKPASLVAKLFDFTATYMSIPEVEVQDQEHSYSALAREARTARALHASEPIPWVPYLAAGWNPRPWTHPKADPNHRRFFVFPTAAEWAAELRAVKEDFQKYPRLGLPVANGQRQPVFTIYAWNEFGEGGIVAPTKGQNYMKLEAIRDEFPAKIHAPPSDTAYPVHYLPGVKIDLDGKANEPAWKKATVEKNFRFPWKTAAAPATEFRALCDDHHLYFHFQVHDEDIVALDRLRDEEDEVFEDRVEFYFSRDDQMKEYYCLEVDSRGRLFDYRGSYYRQLDPKWNFKELEARASSRPNGYEIELKIALAELEALGFPKLQPGARIRCGLYRAEFSHDRSGRLAVQKETLHNRGRQIEGPPPIENWISWIDPKTAEPDFHVPASLGWLEVVR